MQWTERGFTLDGTRFRVDFGPDAKPDDTELLLLKPRWMVERYTKLIAELQPKRMLELGIYHGGSIAFHALLAEPDRYVAIDLQPNASARFDAWVASHDDTVRTYYGVDQADAPALRRIVADEFADEPLDLVIDDASHVLDPTRASFNALFPLLRPGGVYVIEDWAVDLDFDRHAAKDPALAQRIREEIVKRPELADLVPLARLVFEIVLASVYTDFIEQMEIRAHWLSVVKSAEPPPPDFDVSRCSSGLDLGSGLGMAQRLLRELPGPAS